MHPLLPVAALLGLSSALHCAGMCGGFTLLALARGRALARFAALHAGRLFVYVFLGSAAGAMGGRLLALGVPSRWLAAVAGIALALVAVERLGLLARAPGPLGRAVASLAGQLRERLAGPSLGGLFGFGMANGFLPCAATAAALALAVGSGGAFAGGLVLLVFGLSTLPTFVVVAWLARRVAPRSGAPWQRAVALAVLLLGLVTLWRGGWFAAAPGCCAGAP
jgi:sulfite exporter TauE/SafE